MINRKILSIILGGGQGTRLAPLTTHRSKPAVPIAGKYRLVDIPISNCLNYNLKRIFVLTQFNSASLNSHVKNTYQFSNFSSGFVDILAAEQTPDNSTWFQGTADAVRQCQHHFHRHDYDYVLILSGDQLYQMDLIEMAQSHIDSGAEISIATQPVCANDATAFGILKTNAENFINTFIEKPSKEELKGWESEVSEEMQKEERFYLASMGIYIFNRKTLDEILDDPSTVDFGKEIIPNAINGNKKVFAYHYEDYWEDIGTIKAFYKANLALTEANPKFNLFDSENAIHTRARILPPSKINVEQLQDSLIAEGCIINAKKIENSIIGVRSQIGKNCIIEDAYVMGNDEYKISDNLNGNYTPKKPHLGIGENCTIKKAIVEKNTCIGNNVSIIGSNELKDEETELYTIKDGIVVVKNNVCIPCNTKIGL